MARMYYPILLVLLVVSSLAKPIALHPSNPHYFIYERKPTILITSGEHYGAVLNLDFDPGPYLDELKSKGLNLTRTFTGAYVEPEGAFNITGNTLAPKRERFIAPWARSSEPGYPNGGNKFDLNKWDPAYFARLKQFLALAEKKGVIVELNLFCPFYEEPQWKLSPQNAANNVNGIGTIARTNVYTMDKHGGLLSVHEAVVRKIVTELNRYDNLYYEICNEPYFGGVTLEWQHHIADVITATESKLRKKHLISQNIANGSVQVLKPHPSVSILNFHYAVPPTAVAVNHSLNRVIGDNETGFRGTNNVHYRSEGWDFIMAGGALYNNLDYSFTADHEDGSFVNYPANQPGGGNPQFRKELQILAKFIRSFDFIHGKVDNSLIRSGVPAGSHARVLSFPNGAYAVYLSPAADVKEQFSVRWSGKIEPRYTETYTFTANLRGSAALLLNGTNLFSGKPQNGNQLQAQVALKAGQKYDLRFDFVSEDNGKGSARLFWSSDSQKRELVSEGVLWNPAGNGRGLQAQYYRGKAFMQLDHGQTDNKIDFDWGSKSPVKTPATAGPRSAQLGMDLPAGGYKAEWISTISGETIRDEGIAHGGGKATFTSPAYDEDIALRIRRANK